MRTIGLIDSIPKDTDVSKFPDSTILNETDTQQGTPVIREIYGDPLTNIYKLLRLAGIEANGIEDSEINGYQIIEALKKLPNTLNDIEQPMNLTGTVFSVAVDLSLLPNKFFMFVRTAEASVSSTSYTFKGSGASPSYTFNPVNPFNSGDELLLIIDTATVRAYNLTKTAASGNEMFVPFGTPLAFNDGSKVFYQDNGVLYSDLPELFDLQAAIRASASDGTLIIYEMMIIQGYVLCLVFAPVTLHYKFYRFALTDLTTPLAVTLAGLDFPTGTVTNDYQPFVYTDGTHLYISNQVDGSANDYNLYSYSINMSTGNMVNVGAVNLDHGFQKTTNAVIVGNKLYTFIAGTLQQYNLSGGAVTLINSFPGFIGNLFALAGNVYYSNGEVAKKWTLAG